MSIVIDKNKCIGCSKCVLECPGSLIYVDKDDKAIIKYPKDCWGCTACVKICPTNAISYYLGSNIGGIDSKLTVDDSGDSLSWKFENSSREKTIVIDRKSSNRY